jgi:hypothetical protein
VDDTMSHSLYRFQAFLLFEPVQQKTGGRFAPKPHVCDRIGLSETNLTFYDPATSWRDSRGFGSDVLLDGWLTFSTREFPANGCICRNHDGVDQLYSIRAATPRSS